MKPGMRIPQYCLNHSDIKISFPLILSSVVEKGKSHTGSPELLPAPLSKLPACIDMTYFLLLTQLGGHIFGGRPPHISIVLQNALNGFKLIPNMLATSKMAIFLFSGTSFFIKSVLLLGYVLSIWYFWQQSLCF